MKARMMVPAAAVALAAAAGLLLAGVIADASSLIVIGVCVGAIGLLLVAAVIAVAARSVFRTIRSTHHYSRLISERSVAIAESVRGSQRAHRPAQPSMRVHTSTQAPTLAGSANADGSVEDDEETTLVVALGDAAESAIRFAGASTKGRLVVLTDRPDVVVGSARHVAVEFIQSGSDVSSDVSLGLVKLLGLASEYSALSVLFWPTDSESSARVVPLESPEIEVFGGHAVRALIQADERLRDRLDQSAALLKQSLDQSAALLKQSLDQSAALLKQSLDQSAAQERRVVASITKLSEQIKKHVSAYIDDVYDQGEALARLYRLLDPPIGLPPMRGWAVSPDLAVYLVESILSGAATSILETGSGTSTVVMALALDRVGEGHVTAIEHDPVYAKSTRELLAAYGVEHWATVLDAPLVEVDVEGEMLPWYDVDACRFPDDIDLLFVDGPPEATGPQARYPAVPIVEMHFAEQALIIMDDGRRAAEQAAVERWSQRDDMSAAVQLSFERQAFQLQLNRAALDPIQNSAG